MFYKKKIPNFNELTYNNGKHVFLKDWNKHGNRIMLIQRSNPSV